MNSAPKQSTLIKEILGFSLLALLFLFFALHRPIFELLLKFDENQWYEGMAVILDSHVKDVEKRGKTVSHSYYVYAHYQYDSMGTTYESHSISNLGNYIIANNRSDAYEAINTYLKPGKFIEVNISNKPPQRSFLFRDKLPNSSNRQEIIMFILAVLTLLGLNKSIRQLRTFSQNENKNTNNQQSSQPNSQTTLNH